IRCRCRGRGAGRAARKDEDPVAAGAGHVSGFVLTPGHRMSEDKSDTSRPRVALALGAGGAKGLAYIGVLEELEARGFDIVAIAGSSMGALIGGIHAAGKLDVYRDWVTALAKLDVLRLVDWTLSGGGLIKGERII